MTVYILEEFVELQHPKEMDEGQYEGKWFVGMIADDFYYLRDDINVHFGTMASIFTDPDSDAVGWFDTKEDAALARLEYYKKHDMLHTTE